MKQLDVNDPSCDSNNATTLPCKMQKLQFGRLQQGIHTG